jgi:hypothetical protein
MALLQPTDNRTERMLSPAMTPAVAVHLTEVTSGDPHLQTVMALAGELVNLHGSQSHMTVTTTVAQ